MNPLHPTPTGDPLAPRLHRWLAQKPAHHMDFGLYRMQQGLQALGNPHQQVPIIHVAGTNGKGSVCHYLDHLLQAAGLTTGRYTSPHLTHLTERFMLNGQTAQWEDLEHIAIQIHKTIEISENSLEDDWTYFEKLTVLAFAYYAKHQPDVLILETGLGGRLDATNVCDNPLLTIITSIGRDHTAILGNTLSQIAREKSGIIKANVPVVLGPHIPADALAVIKTMAHEKQAAIIPTPQTGYAIQPVSHPSTPYSQWHDNKELQLLGELVTLPLLPTYQAHNIATALTAYQSLQSRFHLPKPDPKALQHQHPARFEWFPASRVVVDGSHNADGLTQLAHNLNQYFPDIPIHWVVSLQSSKDLAPLLALLNSPQHATQTVHWCKGPADDPMPFYPLPVDAPAHWIATTSPTEALEQAQNAQNTNDIIVITGSLHTAGSLRPLLQTTAPS